MQSRVTSIKWPQWGLPADCCWDGGSSCARGSRSSSAQKLEQSAGSLLNKEGERALFFFVRLPPFTLSFLPSPFFFFFFFSARGDHGVAERCGDLDCLLTLSAEEWLLWMGTLVMWPCCRISLQQEDFTHPCTESMLTALRCSHSAQWYQAEY